jgi:hypothetical protein
MSASSRKLSVAFALITLATASTAAAQVPRRPVRVSPNSPEQSAPVTLALAVGAQKYAETKPGQCKHAPKASIYNTPAMMWTVQYSPSSSSSIALTLWRPTGADATQQVNLSVQDGNKSHQISTVKGGKVSGTATVTFIPRGAGGRFEIDGTTAEGVRIRGSIDCERITALVAEGGD